MTATTRSLLIQAALEGSITKGSTAAPSVAGGAGATLRFGQYNRTGNDVLTGSTTPSVTEDPVDFSRTMAAASEVIDLTAAPAAEDINETIDLTGKKLVQMLVVANSGNNASGVIIDPDPTDGYNIFGASGQITLYPGMVLGPFGFLNAASLLPTVSASVKRVRLQGTIGDILEWIAWFGA